MVLQNNTILITGGSSGIGLELARQLSPQNTVLICGRTLHKLEQAQRQLPGIHYVQCDISKMEECEKLRDWVRQEHPGCNILINNAAIVHRDKFFGDDEIPKKAETEIQTNLLAPIRLASLFAPILWKNSYPKIINISTGLAYVPRTIYPFYNASKAGLHSFTQVLRAQAEQTPIKVIEVLFPAVDTPWHNGNPPDIAISPEEAVREMLLELEKGRDEIRVGKVSLLWWLSRLAPKFAFRKINSLSTS